MKRLTLPAGKRNNKQDNGQQQHNNTKQTGGASPTCTSCKERKSQVIDSRQAGDKIRRRRRCLHCGGRFTTYEETVEIQELDYSI